MAQKVEREQQEPAEAAGEEHESHELPRGALLLTIGFLTLLTLLWLQVYLQLLMSGGIAQ